MAFSGLGAGFDAVTAGDLTADFRPGALVPLPSPWAGYFGTHYASSPEGGGTAWSTVRSYGGTHVGIHEENPSAPPRKGPFGGREVRFTLDDFHAARGGKTARQLIPELISNRLTAVYLMSNVVRPTLEPFDKDRAYWAVRQIHEAFPAADRAIVWQMGNEIVSGHFDPKGVWNRSGDTGQAAQGRGPAQREDNFFGYDLAWKEDYYVNDYLAPAIEATERASKDVYGDPRRIRIALGSMNPYNRPNLVFLSNVMARTFDGRQAPTLKGEPVWKHIDLLTVHYMAGSPGTVATLQRYHDDYLMTGRVRGIWITEDHGHAGKGPVTIVDRGLRFLAWAARNRLSADQARLCWWGEGAPEPGGRGREATALLGGFLAGRPLHFAHRREGEADVYLLGDGADASMTRGLVAVVPARSGALDCGKLTIPLPPSAAKKWHARLVRYSAETPPHVAEAAPSRDGDVLETRVDARISGAWLLLFARDPTDLPTPTPNP